jgi:hypothetical protein
MSKKMERLITVLYKPKFDKNNWDVFTGTKEDFIYFVDNYLAWQLAENATFEYAYEQFQIKNELSYYSSVAKIKKDLKEEKSKYLSKGYLCALKYALEERLELYKNKKKQYQWEKKVKDKNKKYAVALVDLSKHNKSYIQFNSDYDCFENELDAEKKALEGNLNNLVSWGMDELSGIESEYAVFELTQYIYDLLVDLDNCENESDHSIDEIFDYGNFVERSVDKICERLKEIKDLKKVNN